MEYFLGMAAAIGGMGATVAILYIAVKLAKWTIPDE